MNRPINRWRAAMVVARRDFLAIVATPTFIVFLLAPLLFIGLSTLGSQSAASLVQNADATQRIAAVVPASERAAFQATDARLRALSPGRAPPQLLILPDDSTHGSMTEGLRRNPDIAAILTGSAARPVIAEREAGGPAGRYLTLLADSVARAGPTNANAADISRAERVTLGEASGSARAAQAGLGYGAVFILFLLILMLGGQTVGTLAEEKGNKVIEILAAAVPMEAVFFGKLVGMLGVALLFVGFWGGIVGLIGPAILSQIAGPDALTQIMVEPALGWPLFLLLCFFYFLMGFMLMGAVFLGLGALASSVREIQMLSLPITLFQVGMFTLGSAAANAPGTRMAMIAEWLPWSSPFAMAGRGAMDASLAPHIVALGWQIMWLIISILIAVRLFRFGVLRSGPLLPWLARRRPALPED